MERGAYMCLVIFGLVCTAQGGTFTITTKFMSGDVIFLWTGTSSYYDVLITRDNTPGGWDRVSDTPYTVKDALLYDSIGINVRVKDDSTDNKMNYTVTRVERNVGESVNISWTAPFFPRSGVYSIYHTDKVNRSIIQVTSDEATLDKVKYEYHSRPYNSTNITFEIRDITLDDAGYYNGGTDAEAAWNGGGVVLIVHDKISKPQVQGNLNISVGNSLELTCSTKSSSAPDYYARLFPLSYTWFVNNTQLTGGETRETMRFLVSREHKYNQYSCYARDKQQISDRSDSVRINPLYKPDKVTITPKPSLNANDKLTVKEGGTVGPYNCSADCNPTCDITWKYKDSDGFYDAVSENGRLVAQKVNRSIASIRCIAKYQPNIKEVEIIKLDVQYLDGPQLFINESRVPYSNPAAVQANEKTSIRLSCNVNGNPNPSIGLRRDASTGSIDEEINTEWLNHTINSLVCSDTDTYTCIGKSMEFSDTMNSIQINVKCDPRLDDTVKFKSNYGSMSGSDVDVTVAVPVIANPTPQGSDYTWSGPTGSMNIESMISQRNVIYTHLVESSIPIRDQQYFGNYTLMYKGNSITTVIISAEDIPKPPANFTGYSYAPGLLNLTWVSGFNGGPEQFFILSENKGSAWKEVANISDPGEGRIGYFDPGPLVPGQDYWYRLNSCNRINCSLQSVNVRVTVVKEMSSPIANSNTTIVIGTSVGILILVLVIAGILALFLLKRKKTEKRRESVQVMVEDSKQPDVVLYASVDKSFLEKKRNKADIVTADENKDNHKEEKSNLIPGPNAAKKGQKKKKRVKETPKEGENTSAEAMYGNTSAQKLNQDGLIYIDIDFANKPESLDPSGKPKIHGNEDRTEYTFVDFSKKAPPLKETPEDEGEN